MEKSRDFYALSPRVAFWESAAVLSMLSRVIYEAFSSMFSEEERSEEVAFFLPGILAPGAIYRSVCAQLELRMQGRVRFYTPRIGRGPLDINCRSLIEARDRVGEACLKHKPRLVVGHSWGGVLALMLLPDHPEVSVCTVGAPHNGGTPFIPLQRLARWILGVDPNNLSPELEALRRSLELFGNRITTISGEHDFVAPPDRCYVPGANNIVLKGGLADLHTGIHMSPRGQAHTLQVARRAYAPQEKSEPQLISLHA